MLDRGSIHCGDPHGAFNFHWLSSWYLSSVQNHSKPLLDTDDKGLHYPICCGLSDYHNPRALNTTIQPVYWNDRGGVFEDATPILARVDTRTRCVTGLGATAGPLLSSYAHDSPRASIWWCFPQKSRWNHGFPIQTDEFQETWGIFSFGAATNKHSCCISIFGQWIIVPDFATLGSDRSDIWWGRDRRATAFVICPACLEISPVFEDPGLQTPSETVSTDRAFLNLWRAFYTAWAGFGAWGIVDRVFTVCVCSDPK